MLHMVKVNVTCGVTSAGKFTDPVVGSGNRYLFVLGKSKYASLKVFHWPSLSFGRIPHGDVFDDKGEIRSEIPLDARMSSRMHRLITEKRRQFKRLGVDFNQKRVKGVLNELYAVKMAGGVVTDENGTTPSVPSNAKGPRVRERPAPSRARHRERR